MGNRDYKEFCAGEMYHVYNRGVAKMDIFNDASDYNLFISRLRENLFPELVDRSNLSKLERKRKPLPSDSFELICYCLMPNHFHLLVRQLTDLPVSQLILKVCTSYSRIFNKKYNRVGTLFQDQFKSVAINTNEQLLWTSLYIHKNPLKAGLVDNLNDYKWNSYLDYAGVHQNNLCKKDYILNQYSVEQKYLDCFNDKELEKMMMGESHLFIDSD